MRYTGVINMIDATVLWETIMSESEPVKEREDFIAMYPSGFKSLYNCHRRAWLEVNKPVERDWGLTAEHGNKIHEIVVDKIKKAGRWRGDEVRGANAEHCISYRIDCMVEDLAGNVVPLEIKSASDMSFQYMIKEPDEGHVLQLMTYLGLHEGTHFDYGYICYYNKNKDEVKWWRVPYDEDMFKRLLARVAEFKAIRNGTECPEPEPGHCKWCEYGADCPLPDDIKVGAKGFEKKRGYKK